MAAASNWSTGIRSWHPFNVGTPAGVHCPSFWQGSESTPGMAMAELSARRRAKAVEALAGRESSRLGSVPSLENRLRSLPWVSTWGPPPRPWPDHHGTRPASQAWSSRWARSHPGSGVCPPPSAASSQRRPCQRDRCSFQRSSVAFHLQGQAQNNRKDTFVPVAKWVNRRDTSTTRSIVYTHVLSFPFFPFLRRNL